MDLAGLALDSVREENGVWIEYAVEDDTCQLLIAAHGNKKYNKLLDSLRKPYARMIGRGNLSEEMSTSLTCRAMAKHILLGWRGVQLHGEEIQYSHEKAYELLVDFRIFREDVLGFSLDTALFAQAQEEESEKNSASSSGRTRKSGRKS